MIAALRIPGDIRRDRAILDLLHLQELGQVPGLVATRECWEAIRQRLA